LKRHIEISNFAALHGIIGVVVSIVKTTIVADDNQHDSNETMSDAAAVKWFSEGILLHRSNKDLLLCPQGHKLSTKEKFNVN